MLRWQWHLLYWHSLSQVFQQTKVIGDTYSQCREFLSVFWCCWLPSNCWVYFFVPLYWPSDFSRTSPRVTSSHCLSSVWSSSSVKRVPELAGSFHTICSICHLHDCARTVGSLSSGVCIHLPFCDLFWSCSGRTSSWSSWRGCTCGGSGNYLNLNSVKPLNTITIFIFNSSWCAKPRKPRSWWWCCCIGRRFSRCWCRFGYWSYRWFRSGINRSSAWSSERHSCSNMILTAALVEGAAFFAMVVACLLFWKLPKQHPNRTIARLVPSSCLF